MYSTLLTVHSIFRWVVLGTLLYSIFRAYIGFTQNKTFSKPDNLIRHWTATAAHIQLIIGVLLYIKSPIIQHFWSFFNESVQQFDLAFFGIYHFLIMISAVIIITIGSALAKRKNSDKEKFRTMLIWFSITLVLILIAIPWPFSPLAQRPFFRIF